MLWIDHETYCGLDRRHRNRLRWRERRCVNLAASPPPLATALRQLQMHILDASGARADVFVGRVQGVAALARMQGESDAADALLHVAEIAAHGRNTDVRATLYRALDRVHATLRTIH